MGIIVCKGRFIGIWTYQIVGEAYDKFGVNMRKYTTIYQSSTSRPAIKSSDRISITFQIANILRLPKKAVQSINFGANIRTVYYSGWLQSHLVLVHIMNSLKRKWLRIIKTVNFFSLDQCELGLWKRIFMAIQ